MQEFVFTDALTGNEITLDLATNNAFVGASSDEVHQYESIFFPGCSFVNFASPLVPAVFDTLKQANLASGISILCCGKILGYDPATLKLCALQEKLLRQSIVTHGVKRIVCACPNCVGVLRRALQEDELTQHVEICALPNVLAEVGYRVDLNIAANLLDVPDAHDLKLCTHDSCPDRQFGQFARGLRQILPEGSWADPTHCLSKSVCCGSSVRAQGKFEQADKCAALNVAEAQEIQSTAIVTACMSCAFQLNMIQSAMPAVHFLELLYNWRINWQGAEQLMKVRFLFDEVVQAEAQIASGRAYVSLDAGQN